MSVHTADIATLAARDEIRNPRPESLPNSKNSRVEIKEFKETANAKRGKEKGSRQTGEKIKQKHRKTCDKSSAPKIKAEDFAGGYAREEGPMALIQKYLRLALAQSLRQRKRHYNQGD